MYPLQKLTEGTIEGHLVCSDVTICSATEYKNT